MMEIAKTTARALRKKQTPGEKILWENVRNRKFLGMKFLRQHPLKFDYFGRKRFIIADFYCHEARMIIELDGASHKNKAKQDELRDLVCNTLGLKVLRFKESDTVKDVESILRQITGHIAPLSFQERGRG